MPMQSRNTERKKYRKNAEEMQREDSPTRSVTGKTLEANKRRVALLFRPEDDPPKARSEGC